MRAAVLALLLAAPASAEAPFQDLTFAEAKALARKGKKFLFVDFVTDGCAPCDLMRLYAYKDPEVLAWLEKNAVSIEPNSVKVPALKDALRVESHPTLILYDWKGKELDRSVGGLSGPWVLYFLTDAVEGRDRIWRSRHELAKSTTTVEIFDMRLWLARTLVRKGRDQEALAEFLWLYDRGPELSPEFRYMSQGAMLEDLVKLGERHPPVGKALEARRAAAWKEFELVPSSTWTARAVVMLDEKRGEAARTIKAYEALPPGDPRRPVLGKLLRR